MDKKELMTVKKKGILLWALFLSIMFLGGCETVKGAACGLGTTAEATAKGVGKDTANLWQAILKADTWIKNNLW